MAAKVNIKLTNLQKDILKYVCESPRGQNVITVTNGLGRKEHVSVHQAVLTLEKSRLIERVRDYTKRNALEIRLTDLGVAVAVVQAGASAEKFFENNPNRISKSDKPYSSIISKIDDKEQRDIAWYYLFKYVLENGYYETPRQLTSAAIKEIARNIAYDQRTNADTFWMALPRLNESEKQEAKRQIAQHKEMLLKALEEMEKKLSA